MAGPSAPTVILLDDARKSSAWIAAELEQRGFRCLVTDQTDRVVDERNRHCAILASARSLHDWPGASLDGARPWAPMDLFVLACAGSLEEALWAGRLGARDYLPIPVDLDRLAKGVEESFQRQQKGKAVIQQFVDSNLARTNGAGETELDPTLAAQSMIDLTRTPTMDDIERQAILYTLTQTGGNVGEAARVLGLGPATVYRKIKRYGIRAKSFMALNHSH